MEQFVDMMEIIEAHNEVVKAFKNSGIKIEFTFENAIKVNGIMQKLTDEACKLKKRASEQKLICKAALFGLFADKEREMKMRIERLLYMKRLLNRFFRNGRHKADIEIRRKECNAILKFCKTYGKRMTKPLYSSSGQMAFTFRKCRKANPA